MTLEAKRRAAVIGLVLFAVWPLVHRGLVAYADISPWRFFGWAMYCQPKIPLQVDVFVRRDDTFLPLDEAAIVRPELRLHRLTYTRRRAIWGSFLPPDHLALDVLGAVPDASGVEIIVRRLVLDPSTAHIAARERRYRYRQDPESGIMSE